MNYRSTYCLLGLAGIVLFSCNNLPSKSHGPIKLGDSAAIVTEEDQHRLQDMVTDLKPLIPPSAPDVDTPKKEVATTDTAKKAMATVMQAPTTLPAGPGMKAEFKEVSALLPNINAKLSGNPNLLNANGAVYTWVSGNIAGNVLHTTGIITKVSMRYQSVIILKTRTGTLPLESLTHQTGWKPVAGGNGAYPIAGIGEHDMEFSDADGGDIRNAVIRAGRSRRLGSRKTQELLSDMGNVRAANQKPLTVTLRSVMWKIDGKDAQGKLFSKQIRIDVPL